MAINNIEQHYSVVALTERYALSLKVLEAYLPKYLTHISKKQLGDRNKRVHSNISEKARAFLKDKLKNEYEVYYFVKQRLENQIKQLISKGLLKP